MTGKPIAGSLRVAGSSSGFQVFPQPRHQLDEVAGAKAVVELVHENVFPSVPAGARRAGQRKQIGAAGDPRSRPTLDRGCADFGVAQPAEELAEPGDLLFVDAMEGFRG